MIIKGLKAIEEAIYAEENEAWEAWQNEQDEWLRECLNGSSDAERFVWFRWSDEDGDEIHVIYHVKDKKVIAVAGIDQTSYKAWTDVPGYCQKNGLDYEALMVVTKAHKMR